MQRYSAIRVYLLPYVCCCEVPCLLVYLKKCKLKIESNHIWDTYRLILSNCINPKLWKKSYLWDVGSQKCSCKENESSFTFRKRHVFTVFVNTILLIMRVLNKTSKFISARSNIKSCYCIIKKINCSPPPFSPASC